jgi:predicted nucleotidyltransferase component of viral defense system
MATLIQIFENQLAQKGSMLSNASQRIMLKGILQAYVLSYLYNHKIYRKLNFYGGTCLKMVYGLNRMSEDIDLDNGDGIILNRLGDDLINHFIHAGGLQGMTISTQRSRNRILRITLKFPVLFALNLSDHENENLHLKIEISHHKQSAVIQTTPLVYFGKSLIPRHYSIETMMAGKILACIERSFQVGKTDADFKARDFYDLLWMMQQKVIPYAEKLERDGVQSYTIRSAIEFLDDRVKRIRVDTLKANLAPLFEDPVFIETWCDSFHENYARFKGYYMS